MGRPKLTEEQKLEKMRKKAEELVEKELVLRESTTPTTGRGGRYNFPNAQLKLIEQDDEKRAFVAKCITNNLVFFNVGIQDPVKSDEELCERLNWFFSQCAETQQIPNVEKMSNAIGVNRNTLLAWGNGNKPGFSPITQSIVTQAKQILASMDAELASEGKTQPVVYMFRAKNFYDMRDQQEVVVTPNVNQVEAVDVATIEAKYAELPDD